ncbi:MAG: hypothetical protein HY209_03000 [Candidatus Omnitrophica bacterium]|nr:hypothetical protein [Candidatus Omnitrophota bacterium]
MNKHKKGQAALIMILVAATALTFYAITLNWSRVADVKIHHWMAATNASTQSASLLASWGERTLWEELIPLGDPLDYNSGVIEHVEKTWLFIKILVIIIVVIITIFTLGATAALLVLVIMLVALTLEYAVITPMQFDIWNKLEKNMAEELDQFREEGIRTGLQAAVNDPVNLPDRFDMNSNGKFGFDTTSNVANDTISRFSFYYTERLKTIKFINTQAYDNFREALQNLITYPTSFYCQAPGNESSANCQNTPPYGLSFSSYCTQAKTDATMPKLGPVCNPKCAGRSPPLPQTEPTGYTFIDPAQAWNDANQHCSELCRTDSSAQCPKNAANASHPYYNLLYDPFLELDYKSDDPASFRGLLGYDDESGDPTTSAQIQKTFSKNKSVGVVYPMLWDMNGLPAGNDLTTAFGIPGSSGALLTDSLSKDPVNGLQLNYRPADSDLATACTNEDNVKYPVETGIWWKSGADRYCSGPAGLRPYPPLADGAEPYNYWPYSSCPYMYNSAGQKISCTQSTQKSLWVQDRLDTMVYGLNSFLKFNQYLQKIPEKTLASSVDTWYPQAAAWIAPQCKTPTGGQSCAADITNHPGCSAVQYMITNNNYDSSYLTCSPNHDGYLIQYMNDLYNWRNQLDNWLGESPDPTKPDPTKFTQFGDSSTDLCSGTITDVITCLNRYQNIQPSFDTCWQNFPPTTTDAGGNTVYPDFTNTTSPDYNKACADLLNDYSTQQSYFSGVTFNPDPALPAGFTYNRDQATYEAFQKWVETYTTFMDTLSSRGDVLSSLKDEVGHTRDLFDEGYKDFSNFLGSGGPADDLMQARLDSLDDLINRLPPFVIYGWKDKGGRIVDNTISHPWHLLRVEMKLPPKKPWVHIYEDICLGDLVSSLYGDIVDVCNYYDFTDGGTKDDPREVFSRVTRWDQPVAGNITKFANKIPIWRFRYNNPRAVGGGDPALIKSKCVGEVAEDPNRAASPTLDPNFLGIGLSAGTFSLLTGTQPVDDGNVDPDTKLPSSTPAIDPLLSASEQNSYYDAFMIDFDPRGKIPSLTSKGYTLKGAACAADPDTHCANGDWDVCCPATYSEFQYRPAGWCATTNRVICAKRARVKYMKDVQGKVQGCFDVVDPLLNQGVKASAGAGYGVPNKPHHDWHEQLYLKNSPDPSKFTPKCPSGSPSDGSTTYGDCTF